MYTNPATTIKGYLTQYVAGQSEAAKNFFTLKIFSVKGKKAKTIDSDRELELPELKQRIIDLESGEYILNAFCRGNFIKSFRFVK